MNKKERKLMIEVYLLFSLYLFKIEEYKGSQYYLKEAITLKEE